MKSPGSHMLANRTGSLIQTLQVIASLIFMMLLIVGHPFRAQSQELKQGTDFSADGCYAHYSGTQLDIGNAHVRRSWRVRNGQLYATSYRDLDNNIEWIRVAPEPAPPTSPIDLTSNAPSMRGSSGIFGQTEGVSLRVELEAADADRTLDYEFQIFPDTSGIRMWKATKQSHVEEDGTVARVADQARGDTSVGQPSADVIDLLRITTPHLRLSQVTLRDQTDIHNELVFVNEWLLQPNEAILELSGNIFSIENTLTGDGLVFLEEAPEPDMRPVKDLYDARLSWSRGGPLETGAVVRANILDLMFCGSKLAVGGQSYRSVLLAYHGGDRGRTAVLHTYQRALRKYEPGRDGLLLSNTWGDRSKELKLDEKFIRQEIDAGKALGVDAVEIDDGWQQGKTTGFGPGGIWEGYWKKDPLFWDADKVRFPSGLATTVAYAHDQGMKLGLWFAPDSSDDFANWRRDAQELLTLNQSYHVDAFKLDSVKIRSERGEGNYHAMLDRVTTESAGKVLLDLDVTAETRQGYFGAIAAGPVFLENRYTDSHTYWPHQTLRNLWQLAHYVDPLRLRIEFLNSERNSNLYRDDPLAPIHYSPGSLFAITMFSSPLAWLENSGLSKAYIDEASPIIATWKRERKNLYGGTILPIGDAPDGVTWTGFASVADKGIGGYLLLFRELNAESTWVVPTSLFANRSYSIQILGGDGTMVQTASGIRASVPNKLGFVWAKLEPAP